MHKLTIRTKGERMSEAQNPITAAEQKKLDQYAAKMTAINGAIMEIIEENRKEIVSRAAKKLRAAGHPVTEEELEATR